MSYSGSRGYRGDLGGTFGVAVSWEGRPEPVEAGKEHEEQISEISRLGRHRKDSRVCYLYEER